ncbi:hypothetical protein BDN71DRAFT_1082659 [Pleurotus eryngii]|uniref:Uncharacterized protein n=1 Tax=Pleurotus eryngii TaxID=5323 RepID=A0A9P5ZUB5_PLEER|nr:hypothetical protein BDN71DRAFT_1082659 [Pleurotus eryngii]
MSPLLHPELHDSHCPKEFWLTYHQISRCNRPSTAQLIELEFKNQKLTDLESLLDHVFQQGFVDNKYRTSTWWERRDGSRVKSSLAIEELFKQGVGKCQDSALRLVIADMPPALWFTYNYVNSPTGHVVAQRIKFDTAQVNGAPFEKLAHVTNHIFRQGYLPARFRSLVHWEGSCGKRLSEGSSFPEVFAEGFGATEERPLRLVIGKNIQLNQQI